MRGGAGRGRPAKGLMRGSDASAGSVGGCEGREAGRRTGAGRDRAQAGRCPAPLLDLPQVRAGLGSHPRAPAGDLGSSRDRPPIPRMHHGQLVLVSRAGGGRDSAANRNRSRSREPRTPADGDGLGSGRGQAHPVLPALPGAGCCGISAAGDAQGDPRPARPLLHGSPRQGPFWKPRPPALDFHLFRAGDAATRQPDRPLPDRREHGQVLAQAGEVLRGPGRGSNRGCRQVRGGHSGRDPHRPEGSEAPPHRRPGLGSQCEGRSPDLTHVQRTLT